MKVGKINFLRLKKLNHYGETYKNYDLRSKTTFKIGGKCSYFLKICTLENFIKVMIYLEEIKVKPFILGNGSNLVISDKGYEGVVISFGGDLKRVEVNDTLIECGAGISLGVAYASAKNLSLSGLEDSAGIPASVGGAVYMNAGAYNFEMSKVVEYVVAYVNGKIDYFNLEACRFSYRHSVFMENKGIILRVGMRLVKKAKDEIEDRFLEIIHKRKETQPLEYGSAGCIFKRRDDILVSKALDDAGFKGMRIGGAMVSDKHANFIINYDNATAQDVYLLFKKIKDEFYKIHKISLESEIIFLGDFDET